MSVWMATENARHQAAVGPGPGMSGGTAPNTVEWAAAVAPLAVEARAALDPLAEAVVREPDLTLKFAFAWVMPSIAYAAAALAERAQTFGAPETQVSTASALTVAASEAWPPRRTAEVRDEVCSTLSRLVRHARDVAGGVPWAWDESTRSEALALAAAVDEALANIGKLRPTAGASEDLIHAGPGRPAGMVLEPYGHDRSDLQAADDPAARILHNFTFESELGALELCAENILLATGMPVEFVIDMAVQCFDEARHATALLERLRDGYGIWPDAYSVSLKLWTRSRGLSLVQRLAVNQRIGEWIGVDALIAGAVQYARGGDRTTANLLQFMARDEVRHVRYGNTWLRWLAERGVLDVAVIDQWADDYRATYGEHIASVTMPLNEAECAEAGFTHEEIERLKRARSAVPSTA